jgi:hypothetical protein
MDMTETLATEKEAIKNGHYRDSGNRKRGNQEWTLQRHWQEKKANKKRHVTDTRNKKRGKQEKTLQRH